MKAEEVGKFPHGVTLMRMEVDNVVVQAEFAVGYDNIDEAEAALTRGLSEV